METYIANLKAFAGMDLDDLFLSLMANAKAVANIKLDTEQSALHLSLLLAKEPAPAMMVLKGDKQGDDHRPGGMLQPHAIKLRSLLLTTSKQMQPLMEGLSLSESNGSGTELEDFAPTDILKLCIDQLKALLGDVRSMWVEDIKNQSQTISGRCTAGWELHLDTLMETPDSLSLLFSNRGYPKTRPGLGHAQEAGRSCSQDPAHGPWRPLHAYQ